jgi:hypothetical protein
MKEKNVKNYKGNRNETPENSMLYTALLCIEKKLSCDQRYVSITWSL